MQISNEDFEKLKQLEKSHTPHNSVYKCRKYER